MPVVGTMKSCDFCRTPVTLSRAPSGWHYWTADGDPVDGGRHCDGGQGPGTVRNPTLRSLHVPVPLFDARGSVVERWAWRYTPNGEGRLA